MHPSFFKATVYSTAVVLLTYLTNAPGNLGFAIQCSQTSVLRFSPATQPPQDFRAGREPRNNLVQYRVSEIRKRRPREGSTWPRKVTGRVNDSNHKS